MGDLARTPRERHRNAPSPTNTDSTNDSSNSGNSGNSSLTNATGTDDMIRATLAAATDGIMAVDDRGTIRFGNNAAADLLGLPSQDLVGRRFGHDLTAGKASEIQLNVPGRGMRVLDARTAATKLSGERMLVAVLRDVTQRKESEHALEEALEQQSAALAVAAHELQSPLAAIGVLAHVLGDKQVSMALPERAKIAERIAELAGRLQMLMQRLLTCVRIEAGGSHGEPEPVRVLEVIIDQLAVTNAAPGAVSVSCSPRLTTAVNRAELTIMLANYVDNALTYGKEPVEIVADEKNGWAVIEVMDHGPGVPRSFEPLLFERFARSPDAERKASGMGLGLWIVRTLAQANGGDAWYEPRTGGGSRFVLRLTTPPSDTSGGGT
jgi:signal transduction histidine kinase